jgi:hypothetical protein
MVGRASPVRADGLERLGVQRTARPTSARMFVRSGASRSLLAEASAPDSS